MNNDVLAVIADEVRNLAHLKPEDWAQRRGGDPIARTINAVLDILHEIAVQPEPVRKIGILSHDNGDYSAYVGFFDDPKRLQAAVDKLNAERLDTDNLEPAQAEVSIHVVERVPDHVGDEFLDRLAGLLSDAGVEIERSDDRRERLEQEETERRETEEGAKPFVPSPGQMEIGEE